MLDKSCKGTLTTYKSIFHTVLCFDIGLQGFSLRMGGSRLRIGLAFGLVQVGGISGFIVQGQVSVYCVAKSHDQNNVADNYEAHDGLEQLAEDNGPHSHPARHSSRHLGFATRRTLA